MLIHNRQHRRSMHKLTSLVHLNHRQLLSPIWEHYILSIWQPKQQRLLSSYRPSFSSSPSQLAALERNVTFHPFNLSSQSVNEERAYDFVQTLEGLRATVRAREFAGRAWWPQSRAGLIEALKAEQECKERGGSREEMIEEVARMSGRSFNTSGLSERNQEWLDGSWGMGVGEAARKREGSSGTEGKEDGKRRRLG